MSLNAKWVVIAVLSMFFLVALLLVGYRETLKHRAEEEPKAVVTGLNDGCVTCHRQHSAALVMQWEASRHAKIGIGCVECHQAKESEVDAWKHEGVWIASLVTPLDCSRCHQKEYEEFSRSHHARAGEIISSLDNVLALKIAGLPDNPADAVNGCWQCHGTIVKFKRDAQGQIERVGPEHKPVIDFTTWPNSGIGRLNPDGSKGSCHACHSRHEFQAKLSRSPENCGKCHMGPDHPQIEIYNESKHGIAFYANRARMALDKDGSWILGKDYSAAPTCATCHISGFVTPTGEVQGNSHDVGERISWTLRPIVSTKLNLVRFDDGTQDDFPDTRALPDIGATVDTTEYVVEHDQLVSKTVPRKVAKVLTWKDRREGMKGVCLNCHNHTYVDNFYQQYDSLVTLYNDKFAVPSKSIMDELTKEGLLNSKSPFGENLQWTFYELWHHEGRRARHGASMQGPDYTHWHGMYEVSKHFYTKFLPEVAELAERRGHGAEWKAKLAALMAKDEHVWQQGMTPEEAKALQRAYEQRYEEKAK
ncbi:MAG: hypothetical protein HYR72_07600 [Deltaproteobacteria bacterium]|nr:hypothetical protein [Deltaproteobacteria bacterium]MBI3386953.1 hypothetical protein [Deltaproteobacteria bacterium]